MTCIPPRMTLTRRSGSGLARCGRTGWPSSSSPASWQDGPELIAPLFTGLSEARAARALTVLARAALTQDRAVSLLRSSPCRRP